jgi:hypothetical protein
MPLPVKESARRLLRAVPFIGKIARQRDALRATVNQLWQPPGHFYSPIPSLDEIRHREAAIFGDRPMAGIDLNEGRQLELLDRIAMIASDHAFSRDRTGGMRYHFGNLAFGAIDALVWAALLRTLQPARVIEVGSGFSTGVLLDTRERYLGAAPEITLIEPYPALVQSLLKADDQVRLVPAPLQDVALEEFDRLQSGDVLFIDSTHVSKTGSDVNYALFEILPRLSSGVYVHIHDVFDHFEYPREWVYQGRAWNEAYLVRAFLQYNTAFEIVLWAPWLARAHPERLRRSVPMPGSQTGVVDPASLWLRKR